MPIKLLLEIGLGVDRSTERTHWDFDFPAAQRADCDDRGRAKPLDNSKIAFFPVPLVLDRLFDRERAFFFLAARCLLTAALARAIVVRPKLIFVGTMPTICHRLGNLCNHREIGAQNAPPER